MHPRQCNATPSTERNTTHVCYASWASDASYVGCTSYAHRGQAFRGLLDGGAFEAQTLSLKVRSCVKGSAFCEEFNADNEDVRIRKRY
eukprot:2632186-Heterocapsa_arctica.AAC.1